MDIAVLRTRRDVISSIIRSYPGGRESAASRLGMNLKKFDNHAYENNSTRPLTERQICTLESDIGSAHLANYIASLYGGIFVKIAEPDSLDDVELYALAVQVAAKRGAVDINIEKALRDGSIATHEAELIMAAHNQHMAARHQEVCAAIKLHTPRSGDLQ